MPYSIAMPGVFGLRAFLPGGKPHQAGEQRRFGRAVVDRGDLLAPPAPRAGDGRGIVGAGPDALAVAAGPEAGVQVDPAQALAAPAMVLQHMAQRLLAPGRVAPAIEQALRVFVLPAGDGGLQGLGAVLGDELRQPGLDLRRRRPFGRHDQVGQPVVGRVARQRLGEILEVAVQVDVFVRGATQPREAIGVERMDVEQRPRRRVRPLHGSPRRRAARSARPSRNSLRRHGRRC